MPLYFAYASNMDPVQMRRCPSREGQRPGAAFLRPACAQGYTLAFTRYSTQRRGLTAITTRAHNGAISYGGRL